MATKLALAFDAHCPKCGRNMDVTDSANEVETHYWIWGCECGCRVEEVANNVLVQILEKGE